MGCSTSDTRLEGRRNDQRVSAFLSSPRVLVLELIDRSDAASWVILRGRSLGCRRAVCQSRPELEVLREINVDLYLTGASGALLRADEHAIREIAAGLHARARGLRAGCTRAAGAADRKSIETQGLLHLGERVGSTAAGAAEGGQGGADLSDL